MIVGITLLFPFTPLGKVFEFHPLPVSFLLVMGMIVLLYMISEELAKKIFYDKLKP